METSENNVLWLTKGEKQYALLFAEDRYHLITINEQCSRKLILKLLRAYPCIEAALQEKQIRFGTILKKDIFGIRFDGSRAGNEFLLRVINQKTGADNYSCRSEQKRKQDRRVYRNNCDKKQHHYSRDGKHRCKRLFYFFGKYCLL